MAKFGLLNFFGPGNPGSNIRDSYCRSSARDDQNIEGECPFVSVSFVTTFERALAFAHGATRQKIFTDDCILT